LPVNVNVSPAKKSSRQIDAGLHIEHQLGPVRQIHITMKNGFHPFGPEIHAIEDHASAIDLERRIHVGAEGDVSLHCRETV
jgi:hypothetical protein